jgi:hypothetical protein
MMLRNSSWIIILLLSFKSLSSQELKLSGHVYDINNSKPLPGANIINRSNGKGGITDEEGYFTVQLIRGVNKLKVSYLGYKSIDTSILADSNARINFILESEALRIEETQIIHSKEKDMVSSLFMSEISLNQFEILFLPSVLGEADPIRFLQLTPGVQSGNEAGVGFFVRGGNVDQNLILYNGATIYNPGHLLGFFSVFNPDVIQDVKILKSGIPSRYGQRLSSVIEVNSIDGNSDSLEISGQIGVISSRILAKRAFAEGKGSFFVSGRRTYLDLFVKPALKPFLKSNTPFINHSNYFFHDFNGGLTYRPGKKDRLSLSVFNGLDDYHYYRHDIDLENTLKWSNKLVSLNWLHSFNERLLMENSLSSTNYHVRLDGSQSKYSFSMNSFAKDLKYKLFFTRISSKGKYFAGIEAVSHEFTPNQVAVDAGNFIIDFLNFNKLYSVEGAVFAEVQHFWNHFSISAGLRYSLYQQLGPYKEYLKDGLGQIYDSLSYSSGESIVFYNSLEPRLSLNYKLNENSSLKASFMKLTQYVHLATSSSVSLPTDIWLPSSQNIKPQSGNQISLGYYHNFHKKIYESSFELYFKQSKNQIEFLRGIINNSVNMVLDENMAFGQGASYGSEFFIRKLRGSLTGWISYTLARTVKDFEEINNGKIYPAKYDRRHDLSIAFIQKLNDKWHSSMVFVYVSGSALTIPAGRYIIQGNLVNEYDEINGFRMPAYHRMDVSLTRENQTKKGNVSSWNFSIYNVYNRNNPFYLYFETTADIDNYKLIVNPKLVSLFPIIPSVSYSFKF